MAAFRVSDCLKLIMLRRVLAPGRVHKALQVHPLSNKGRNELGPILHRRPVKMLRIVLHLMPEPRERRRDQVKHLDTPVHKRHMVVRDEAWPKMVWLFV